MKVTLNWLKEFVDIKLSPQELADRLTLAGLEVERIETVGAIPASVITVKIEKVEKHPNADRLTLCEVNLGTERRRIVCGAKNMKEGDVVALAQPGTTLPDGKKIERSKIRDVVSDGMLCSGKELGMAEDSAGLLILAPDLPLGKPLMEVLPISDTIFEINVTPNRADCLSVLGVAREISASTDTPLKDRSPKLPQGKFSLKGPLKVEVKDAEGCPRYSARMIQGVKIAPSPLAVQLRLKYVGLRPINNVVDATNYVMIERGQPLHAFDYEQISSGTIRVERRSPSGKFKTLDEMDRTLDSSDLLITDPEKILAIAGVMGGLHSGVTDTTRTLVLESAYFDPASVRKTSKRLGLMTESSYRFERGVDPNGVGEASDRLTELILAWAGGEASQEVIDTADQPFALPEISLRRSRTQTVLGYDNTEAEIDSVLRRLALRPKKSGEGIWRCQVPTYRRDLTREIDLIEEVARLQGYDRIPEQRPRGDYRPVKDNDEGDEHARLRGLLRAKGFTETIHYSFCSQKEIEQALQVKEKTYSRLANPLSEELAVLRPSLIPSMLRCLQWNFFRQNEDMKLFEFRNTYHFRNAASEPEERKTLCLALSGKRSGRHWALPREEVDFYDWKGEWETIADLLRLPSFQVRSSAKAYLHPGKSAEILIDGQAWGDFGVLHPALAHELELIRPVVLGEIYLPRMTGMRKDSRYQPLPKFPSIERDLTVVVPEALEGEAVIQKIRDQKIETIRQVNLFDIYRGKPIEEGKKALTYFIQYQDEGRTLTDDEVNQIHTQMVETLKTLLPIEWR